MIQDREARDSVLREVPDAAATAPAPRIRPGQQQLSRDFVLSHQRARIINALAEEVVERGYRDATVGGIVSRAGVARNTFYEVFANKEECFLAASDTAAQEAMRRIVDAVGKAGDSWPLRVRAAVGEFLAFASSNSALARVYVVESLSAGPAAVDRYEQAVRAVVPLLRRGRQYSAASAFLPDTLEETIVGGVFWIVYQRIVADRPEELIDVLPELVEFALTPYIGAEEAREVAEAQPC